MKRVYQSKGMLLLAMLLFTSACATAPVQHKDYSQFRAADPKSLLVVPAINMTVEVDAPDYFLSTITRPLAERGFYVFPAHLVKRLLEDDGLSDANLVHQADPTRLAEIFGADAILYVTIERWDARYSVLSTTVTVKFTYVIKSGETGEELWRNEAAMVYKPQNNNSSGNALVDLLAAAVTAAVTKAAPNYIPLTQQANQIAVIQPHHGLPAGPYHPMYQQDGELY